jgi:hypothetical protein
MLRLTRVYNVAVHPAVYRLLLEAGVDLSGTEHLRASRGVLRGIATPKQGPAVNDSSP